MKKFSLNANIVAILVVFIAGSAALSFVSLNKLGNVNDSLSMIVKVYVKRLRVANQLRSEFRGLSIAEKNYVLEDSKEVEGKIEREMESQNEALRKKIEEGIAIGSEEGKLRLAEFRGIYEEWWKISETLRSLAHNGKDDEAYAMTREKGAPLRLRAESMLQELIDLNQKRMDDADVQADVDYAHARTMLIVISLLVLAIGCTMAFLILRAVSRSINQVIEDLNAGSAQVSAAAGQIATSSEELSHATTEQAAAIQQTAAAIEQMTSMIGKNAENARRAAETSDQSEASAMNGKQSVTEMLAAIDEINRCNDQVGEIVKVIAAIGNKTKVINDIVFQTKLLSFNASVEAARAGDHGKGFAVVAEEVGKLAAMSGNAARDIAEMLDGSLRKVEGIVDDAKAKVDAGTRVANRCGTALEELVSSVSSVRQMAGEISTASREQSQGIQEITKAMNQLDQVVQVNASTSEEAASAAEELSGQADSMMFVVQTLIRTIQGEGSAMARQNAIPQIEGPVATGSGAKKSRPAKASPKVLSLQDRLDRKKESASAPVKKVANGTPAYDDSRFEDV